MEVKYTEDLSIFKTLHGNRPVSDGTISMLVRQFEKHGNITKTSPILVNSQLEVVDGQHRLAAAKKLGLPVYYLQVEGLTLESTRDMNRNQKQWRLLDYAHSYANNGLQPYKDFLALVKRFSGLPATTILHAYTYGGGRTVLGAHARFKEGLLSQADYESVKGDLEMVEEMSQAAPHLLRRSMGYSMIRVARQGEYDHDRMLAQLDRFGHEFKPYQSAMNNLRLLEEVYNKGRSNRVRFS